MLIDKCSIYGRNINSRLMLGTARYPSPSMLGECVKNSETSVITVSLRREALQSRDGTRNENRFWSLLQDLGAYILPNTAGCFSAAEAITTAHMARDLFGTNWIKLEVIADAITLAPEPKGLVAAAESLCRDGFDVFPYTTADIQLGRQLVEAGCSVLMPWAAPIGTGRGITDFAALVAFRQEFPKQFLVVDAGIGKPSQAAAAMELGYDAVLVNTAIATAGDPVSMARAFGKATAAGREAYLSGLMTPRSIAVPSTPMDGLAFTTLGGPHHAR